MFRRLKIRWALWRLDRAGRKQQKLVPTNRATRRRDARQIAGRKGDQKAIYRALKQRER